MGEFFKYPHIDGLHKVPEIFAAEEIVATEKVHGTNFRVMIPAEGPARFGSRNNEIGLGAGFYGDRPIQWFIGRIDDYKGYNRLSTLETAARAMYPGQDVTLYGEIYGSGIQQGVTYVDGDFVQFRAFDVRVGERLLDFDDFVTFCNSARLPMVPILYRGKPSTEALNGLLERNSDVAVFNGVKLEKNIAEGVVIRPTKMRKNQHDQWVLAKHKSIGFAEDHQGKRGPVVPKLPGPCLGLAERFVTRGRLLNAIDKAKEAGKPISNSMSDMQVLPEVVFTDVCLELMNEELTGDEAFADPKALKSAVTRQTAIIYKALLDEQIGVVAAE